jgi:hypothetical protein
LKILPEGIYRYSASTQLGTEKYTASGEFIVNKNLLERRTLNANHGMLYLLSNQHNGQLFHPEQLSQLSEILSQNKLKGKIFYEEKFTSLRDLQIILILIILLLSVEWFFRKYMGNY